MDKTSSGHAKYRKDSNSSLSKQLKIALKMTGKDKDAEFRQIIHCVGFAVQEHMDLSKRTSEQPEETKLIKKQIVDTFPHIFTDDQALDGKLHALHRYISLRHSSLKSFVKRKEVGPVRKKVSCSSSEAPKTRSKAGLSSTLENEAQMASPPPLTPSSYIAMEPVSASPPKTVHNDTVEEGLYTATLNPKTNKRSVQNSSQGYYSMSSTSQTNTCAASFGSSSQINRHFNRPGPSQWTASQSSSMNESEITTQSCNNTPPSIGGTSSATVEGDENAESTSITCFLASCVPSMASYTKAFIDFGCHTEEYLLAVSTWSPDMIHHLLTRLGPDVDGEQLTEMDKMVLINHFLTYFQ